MYWVKEIIQQESGGILYHFQYFYITTGTNEVLIKDVYFMNPLEFADFYNKTKSL